MTRPLPHLGRDRATLDEDAKTRVLSSNELREMTAIASCARGQIGLGPERAGEVPLFLNHGGALIYWLNAEAKKLVAHDLKPVTVFGEMSVLGQGTAGDYAETTADSQS